jgi:hypothetical protein
MTGKTLGRLGLVALLLGSLLWVFWGADAFHEHADAGARAQQSATNPALRSPQRVAEGEYLARIGNCGLCHTAPGGPPFAGGRSIATPFGSVPTTNITPDRTHGIGEWTADDFWRALHHGKSRDGRRLSPAFPYTSYTHITRDDADALFAYLQTVPPAAQANAPTGLSWPFNTQAALAVWRALYFWPQNDGAAPTDRGAYLAEGLGHCTECHGTRGPLGGLQNGKKWAGAVLPGTPWYAPSLQRQDEAATRSVGETVTFFQTGISTSFGQSFASGPMAEVVLHGTQYLRDADAQAIARYLQSVADAPVAQTGSVSALAASGSEPRPARLYADHCADCHGKDGQGQLGAYPALAGSRTVLMDRPNNAVLNVLYGGFSPATAANPRPFGMPPFLLTLNDADIALVLTHVRNAWGNQAPAVSELQVQQLRRMQTAR